MSFRATNYLLFEKDKDELEFDIIHEFSPYLTKRYFSFYDSDYVNYINDTINTYDSIFSDKNDTFRLFDNIIPKLPKRRIEYVKRPGAVRKKEEEIPIPEFYSKREIDSLNNLSKYIHERSDCGH